jgi:cell division transport system permease protein
VTGWLARHVQALLFAAGRLARAPFATGFTVLVIAIALTLPAAFGLLVQSLQQATSGFVNAVDVTVYFKPGTPEEKARQLATAARERPDVASVRLVTADEALRAFRDTSGFGEALDALGANPLPHALDVRPTAAGAVPARLDQLKAYLAAWPEVDLVQVDTEWVQRLDAILDLLRRIVAGSALLLGAGVLAVIGNTIRLEIHNRRAEIEVTKLVGGSNGFVRRPFLYTGLLYGGSGALLAAGLLTGISVLLGTPVARLAATYGSGFALASLAARDVGLLVATGAGLGWIGAFIAATRHLARIEPRA